MAEDTCKKEECWFWKKFKGRCPNYIESTFVEKNTGRTKTVSDCAPVRNNILLIDIYQRLEGLQSAQESMRNETAWVQVVAEVLGKNSGIDLEHFVEERRRQLKLQELKETRLIEEEND